MIDGYTELANAIIAQACKDYRDAKAKHDEYTMSEVKRFLLGGWFGQLSSLDPEYLLSLL